MTDPTLHVTAARIQKVPTPKSSCRQCRGKSTARHVHLEDMWKPMTPDDNRVYWQILPGKREHYEKALVEPLKKLWHDRGYDPYEEAIFKDSKDYFSAVILCRKRGHEFAGKLLNHGSLDPERVKLICLKQLEQWELTPVS